MSVTQLPWAGLPVVEQGRTYLSTTPCDACYLHRGAKTAGVSYSWAGEGITKDRPILFVGDAPSLQDDHKGEPFVGDEGQFLRAKIRECGIPDELVALSSVVQCIPLDDPRNRGSIRAPNLIDIACCHTRLLKEIHHLNPQLIVPLGVEASMFFRSFGVKKYSTKSIGLSDQRAQLYSVAIGGRSYQVFPTYHPSTIADKKVFEHLFSCDLENVRAITQGQFGLFPPTILVEDDVSVEKLFNKCRVMYENRATTGVYHIAIDLETMGFDAHTTSKKIVGMALSYGHESAFYIPVSSCGPPEDRYISKINVEKFRAGLKTLLDVVPISNQNIQFDYKWMAQDLGVVPTFVYGDPLLTSRMMYGDQRRGQGSLDRLGRDFMHTHQYADALEAYKSEHGIKGEYDLIPLSIIGPYAGLDAWVSWHVLNLLLQKIVQVPKFGLLDTPYRITMGAIKPMAEIELAGLYIDRQKHDELTTFYTNKFRNALEGIYLFPPLQGYFARKGVQVLPSSIVEISKSSSFEHLYEVFSFNPASSPQVAEVLFDYFDYPFNEEWRAEKGARSTAEDVLLQIKAECLKDRKLVNKVEPPPQRPIEDFIDKLFEFRVSSKMLSTYVLGMIPFFREDGTLRVKYNLEGAATGRTSAEQFAVHQMPKDKANRLRELMVSRFALPYGEVKHLLPDISVSDRHYTNAWVKDYPLNGGGLFVSFDFSQLELRVLACVAKDESLLQAFENGQDLHRYIASRAFYPEHQALKKLNTPERFELFGKFATLANFKEVFEGLTGGSVDDALADLQMTSLFCDKVSAEDYAALCYSAVAKKERSAAKEIIFGIIYGSTAQSIAEKTGRSLESVERLIADIYRLFPGIKIYVEEQHRIAINQGVCYTPTHRIRYLFDALGSIRRFIQEALRQAQNTPIQGAASDITLACLALVLAEFIKLGLKTKIVGTVHDSILFDVYPGEFFIVYSVVKNIMEVEVFKDPAFSWVICKMQADVDVGRSWGQLVGIKSLTEHELKVAGDPLDVSELITAITRCQPCTVSNRYTEKTQDGIEDKATLVLGETYPVVLAHV